MSEIKGRSLAGVLKETTSEDPKEVVKNSIEKTKKEIAKKKEKKINRPVSMSENLVTGLNDFIRQFNFENKQTLNFSKLISAVMEDELKNPKKLEERLKRIV